MDGVSMRAFMSELIKISKRGDVPTDDAHGIEDVNWRESPHGAGQPPRPSQYERFERPATYLRGAAVE